MYKLFCISITVSFFSITTSFSQPLFPNAQYLLSFCKLYSTVKYYYPDPHLQDFPWDAFAYQGYKLAKTSENDEEFIKGIDTLFSMVAPGVQISKKEFNLALITPKDTSLYSEKAFWQHQGGLDAGKPSRRNGVAFNYIYPVSQNRYGIEIYLEPDIEKYNKKTRLSLWIKTENVTDSVSAVYFATITPYYSAKRGSTFEIKALNNEWKQYFLELNPDDSVIVDQFWLGIGHPLKGTVYIDDLKVEIYNDSFWEPIFVPNSDFEQYDANGKFRFWTEFYGGLAIADSINAIEGKYCLKLPAIQEQILYPSQPLDKPHAISLPAEYFAYIPLQLYANDKVVFPLTDTTKIKHFAQKIKTEQDTLSPDMQAIAWSMQIWAALYQDYPYRNINFEKRINRLLFNTINKLQIIKGYKDVTSIPYQEFLVWINDPHARIWFNELPQKIKGKRIIEVPVSDIELTEKQCIVKSVADTFTMIQRGDILLQINNIDIDSLLQIYRNHNISRNLQGASVWKMFTSMGKSKLTITVKRGNNIIPLEFTTKTNAGYAYRSMRKYRRQFDRKTEADALHDSLKQQGLFYVDCESYKHQAFSTSLLPEQELAHIVALNSLVTEINGYNALILDVRGERGDGTMNLLHVLNECYGIDINKERWVKKTAFSPVAQFKKDTVNLSLEEKKEIAITIPIYVLIDLHTHSASELALLNLKQSDKAVFIGSNTSGAAGYQCAIKIADDIFLYYTSGQMVGLDDNPMSYQGTGIAPDVYVYPTPQGIAEGRDEVLEKAIEMALKSIREKE
jgi:C-terminal processing protease CtpA/Prc